MLKGSKGLHFRGAKMKPDAHLKRGGKAYRKYADGGTPEVADGNPFVIREAKKRTNIGKIDAAKTRGRMDRKRGGRVHRSDKGHDGYDGYYANGGDVTPAGRHQDEMEARFHKSPEFKDTRFDHRDRYRKRGGKVDCGPEMEEHDGYEKRAHGGRVGSPDGGKFHHPGDGMPRTKTAACGGGISDRFMDDGHHRGHGRHRAPSSRYAAADLAPYSSAGREHRRGGGKCA